MDRDTEVRKCMALWKTGVNEDGLPSREAMEMRVRRWAGAQIDKGLDYCTEELRLQYERNIRQGSEVIGSVLQENNWLQYAGWIGGEGTGYGEMYCSNSGQKIK